MTPAQMDQKLDEHFGYEMRDDVEGVLATLSADIEHDVVGWPTGPSRGREAARSFYEATFADLTDGQIENTRRLYGDHFMVDDSIWRGRAAGRPFGIEGRNRPLEFRILHILEFDDVGAIARENVWLDVGAILRQLPEN